MASPSTTVTATLAPSRSHLPRLAVLAFGLASYAFFLDTFVYLIGFVAGAMVPKHIDSGTPGALWPSLATDGAFLALFAVQHAVMARPAFKRRWTQVVPAHLERSVFVALATAILAAMVVYWRPLPDVVWHVDGIAAIALWALSGGGWLIVLLSTFLIDHFELFGVRQVVRHFRGLEQDAPAFRERGFYKLVRHPLMVGFLIAFWATPHMTVGHLFFAAVCTGYIFVGTAIEERTLVALHGDTYRDYRRRVNGFVPLPRRTS